MFDSLRRGIERRVRRRFSPSAAGRRNLSWTIGIYTGASPLDLEPAAGAVNPVITLDAVTDVPAEFVADPFLLRKAGHWYMLLEVLRRDTHKGVIAFATSGDGLRWEYQHVVLAEPYQLTHPYVFEWLGDVYMMPECSDSGGLRLYRASRFPTEWSFVGSPLSGGVFLDASIFRYRDRWWLFTETNPEHKYDTLRLYHADALMGPWTEHPMSPVIAGDPHLARPAGRVVVLDDRLIRYTQDCFPTYGKQVRAFEITELTTSTYRERPARERPIQGPAGSGWNARRMHHVDPHRLEDGRWLTCVDGRS